MGVKKSLFRTMMILSLAGIPIGVHADEIAPAGDSDFAGFEQLVQDSIEKSKQHPNGKSSFGQAISEEARRLNQELVGKGNPVSGAASVRGKKLGHGKGENRFLKEQKKKLKVKSKKND